MAVAALLSFTLAHLAMTMRTSTAPICASAHKRLRASYLPAVMCASADEKRLRAEQLKLLAEQAELEAESLEIQARKLRPDLPSTVDAPPPPASPPTNDEPMALCTRLRWLGPYPAVALSLPDCSSPAQKARMLYATDDRTQGLSGDALLKRPVFDPRLEQRW